MADYNIGDVAVLTATFVVVNTPTDPTGVSLQIKAPTGVVTTTTYPPSGGITRTGPGVYTASVPITAAGQWVYRWVGTGVAAAAVQGFLRAAPSSI